MKRSFAVPSTPTTSRRTSLYGLKTPSTISKTTSRRDTIGNSFKQHLNTSLNTSINSSFTLSTPKRRGSIMPSSLNSSFVPSTPSSFLSTSSLTTSAPVPSFYELKKKEEEQTQRIEQLENEILTLKSQQSELNEQISSQQQTIQNNEIQWQQKLEQMKREAEAKLTEEKLVAEKLRESIEAFERREVHLRSINSLYASKLEEFGMNPIDITNLEFSESEQQKRDQMQHLFNEKINNIQSHIDLVNNECSTQQNSIQSRQSDLDTVMAQFKTDLEDDIFDREAEHIAQMKQRFMQLIQMKDCKVESNHSNTRSTIEIVPDQSQIISSDLVECTNDEDEDVEMGVSTM